MLADMCGLQALGYYDPPKPVTPPKFAVLPAYDPMSSNVLSCYAHREITPATRQVILDDLRARERMIERRGGAAHAPDDDLIAVLVLRGYLRQCNEALISSPSGPCARPIAGS